MDREIRRHPGSIFEIRENTGKGPVVAGYVVEFEKLSLPLFGGFREKVRKGCFAAYLRGKEVTKALWNHDPRSVLGSTKNGTLALWEDNIGLRFELELPDTTAGQDAEESIRRGDVDGVSFGFSCLKDEWDNSDPNGLVRTLVEASLYEISPCTFPAYPSSTVAVRSAQLVFEEHERRGGTRTAPASVSDSTKRAALIAKLKKSIEEDRSMQFRNLGEFVAATRWNPLDLRALGASVGANGGFLIPDQFRAEVLMIRPDEAIVRPRAMVLPPGDEPDAKITIPLLKQGANGVLGGMQVYWLGENDDVMMVEPEFAEAMEMPNEMNAIVTISDKLLRNSPVASSFLEVGFHNAIAREEDRAFLVGGGTDKPLGVVNCPGRIVVDRNTADTITYPDVIAIIKKLLPSSWGRAVWVANINALEPLLNMVDAAGNLIFKLGEGGTRQHTLAGFPLIFTDLTPPIGNLGDLMLCDFLYYAIKDGAGPFITSSQGSTTLFNNNLSMVKLVWSVDGQGYVYEPLTLDDGVTEASPFVILR